MTSEYAKSFPLISRANPLRAHKHAPRVYFAACAGFIKVGTSVNVRARLGEISCYTPSDLELIGTIDGGIAVERKIHDRLKAHHHRREWFLDCDTSRSIIAEIIRSAEIDQAQERNSAPTAIVSKFADPTTAALNTELKKLSRDEISTLAEYSALDFRIIGRALCGNRIKAEYHLKLCAGIGYHPVYCEAMHKQQIGYFDRKLFGRVVREMRYELNYTLRDLSQAGISYCSVWRIERGDETAIDTIVRACRFLTLNPFEYAVLSVPRGSTEIANSENAETRSAA